MTQKEKLYEQVLIAENEYKALKGDKHPYAIVGMKNSGILQMNAKAYSLKELKESLANMQAKVEAAKQAKAVEEYFATPEGAARKQELEDNLVWEQDSLLFSRQKYSENMTLLIRPHLDENWKVRCYEASNIYIYLADLVDGKEIFGHSFELHLGYDINKDDKIIYHVDANIGSRTLNVTHDKDYLSLFKTFADIISNKPLMDDVLSIMLQAKGAKDSIQERISEIKRQLKKPLA